MTITGSTIWDEQIDLEWQRSLSFAIGVFDHEGRVQFANRGMSALLELEGGNAQPSAFFRAPPFASFVRAAESGEPAFTGLITIGNARDSGVTLEGRAFHRNGQVLIVCEHNAPELARGNAELAVLNQEVNNLQRALLKEKRALSEANSRLEALLKEKDRFVGIAAHDLRSPLMTIQLTTGVLDTPGLAPEHRASAVGSIRRAAGAMVNLVNDLLDISAIKRGTLELKRAQVPIGPFLSSVVALNEPVAAAKGIALTCDLRLSASTTGWFDPNRIEQVLNNLLSNAFKFSQPNTCVKLGVRSVGAELELWVEDQGLGIDAGEIEGAFDEFSKTSTRPTAGERSTGLGLAICKRIVSLHGGTIGVRSAPGQGSRFHFRLPMQVEQRG